MEKEHTYGAGWHLVLVHRVGGRTDDMDWYRIGVIYPPAFPLPSFLEWTVEHWLPCGQSRRFSLFGVGCPLGRWTGRAGGRMVGWGC